MYPKEQTEKYNPENLSDIDSLSWIHEIKHSYKIKFDGLVSQAEELKTRAREELEASENRYREAVESAKEEREKLTEKIKKLKGDTEALTERVRVAEARVKLNGGIDCDLTERENFNELEREFNAFKKLYEEQWAKTKKAIRKKLINMKNIKEQSEQGKDSE